MREKTEEGKKECRPPDPWRETCEGVWRPCRRIRGRNRRNGWEIRSESSEISSPTVPAPEIRRFPPTLGASRRCPQTWQPNPSPAQNPRVFDRKGRALRPLSRFLSPPFISLFSLPPHNPTLVPLWFNPTSVKSLPRPCVICDVPRLSRPRKMREAIIHRIRCGEALGGLIRSGRQRFFSFPDIIG